MTLKIKIEDERLLQPEYRLGYATAGAAAIDLRACGIIEAGKTTPLSSHLPLYPGDEVLLSAGFKMELPEGYAAVLLPRSGLGARHGIVLGNLAGLVDSDYRNDVGISLWNRTQPGERFFLIHPMDRIAQMMIVPIDKLPIVYVDSLSATDRNMGGFGSTGVT
jgi:dUTP pyrophosphatase